MKAAGQGVQPMERVRIMVQARQRRAEQLLLQAVDNWGVLARKQLRGVLARALYNWGLGHARDRARCRNLVVLVGVRSDMIARCWGLRVGCLLVYWWNSVCMNERWEFMARRFMAIQGFIPRCGAPGHLSEPS